MAVSLLRGLAARAPAPVYCLVGDAGRRRARELQLADEIRLVSSPRHAAILLAVGYFPPALRSAARQIHDQLAEPRGVVLWSHRDDEPPLPASERVDVRGDPVPAITALFRDLVQGLRASSGTLGPVENPIPWRGAGTHGQGGEGMMGGRPYGRAMAMTGPDLRDGLVLDLVRVPLGPFLPWLPPGLRLVVDLQGDVVQRMRLKVPPGFRHRDLPAPFPKARTESVPLAELELARARHHLGALADLLFLLELKPLGRRALQLARELRPSSGQALRRLDRTLARAPVLRQATSGVGHVPAGRIPGQGPVARAAGLHDDARSVDPAYRDLDFRPIVQAGGDAWARWRQRLAEAIQAVELAGRAGERIRPPSAPLEGPRGPVTESASPAWARLVEQLAPGLAWDELATTLVSLDLDVAALGPTPTYADVDAEAA